MHGDGDGEADRERDQAVGFDRRRTEKHAAAQAGGFGQHQRLWPPQHDHELLDDGERSNGYQDLAERRAIDLTNDDAFEDKTERAARGGGRHECYKQRDEIECQREFGGPACKRPQHRDRDVSADSDKSRMREVEHIHEAEDQRQPGSYQEQHDAHGEAGDCQRHPWPDAHRRQSR